MLMNRFQQNAGRELQSTNRSERAAGKKGSGRQIVEAKIRNQASLLRLLGKDGDKLKPLYTNVKSGDTDNREAIAAKIYWTELFGKDFIRSRDGRTAQQPAQLRIYHFASRRSPFFDGLGVISRIRHLPPEPLQCLSSGRRHNGALPSVCR